MRTTYVFGAGASRHVGYPLASTMGIELLGWMDRRPERYRFTADLIREHFGELPNIEDVITQLSSEIRRLRRELEQERIQRVLFGEASGKLAEAVREWFREIHHNNASVYAEFAAKVIKSEDVIVTFNYDDSAECELKRAGKWELATGYGFKLGATPVQSPVLVLKLHGSINWLISLFGGITSGPVAVGPNLSMGQHPVIHKADAEYLGFPDFTGHTYPGGGAIPCLIMPGRKKEFFYDTSLGQEFTEFWDSLWLQADRALRRTERIVLIGYSLLPVDERACDLILKAPERKTPVVIVSGEHSERIAGDFRKAGFTDVSFENARFEDWLSHNQQL